MKIIKIIILLVLSGAVIFLVETNIKTEYIQNMKQNAKISAEDKLRNQKENIKNGLKNKRDKLIEITNALGNQDTFDGITGILAGNSKTFEWIEYLDTNGVPKYTTKKVPKKPKDYIYILSSKLEDGAKLNVGINIKNFINKSLLNNLTVTKNPSKILKEYKGEKYITAQSTINNTKINLIYHKNISSQTNSILFLEIAIGILALIAIFFILFKKRNKEFDTLKTFMEQVRKGNEDLRFEIIEKDPLSDLKENINNILNKIENLRFNNETYSSAIQIINKLQKESSLNKKINLFIKELTDNFQFSNIHAFIKTGSKKVIYTNKSNQYTVNYTGNMDKIIRNKKSNILKDFNINSLLDVQINQNFSSTNYKISHIGNYGILLFPQEEFDGFNIAIGNMLVNTIINNIKLHKDKNYNLQEKIQFNKMFKKLNTGLIWVDHEGHIKLINRYIENIFEINFDVEGMLVGQFFNKINLDFKPIAESFNSNEEKKYTIIYDENIEFEISTTFIPISENTEKDFVINIKNIGKFKIEEKNKIENQNRKIKDLNEQITTLQNRIQNLQNKVDSLSENNINFDIIDPIANDITINSTRMLKALNKLKRMLFDDSEKKYVSFLKNQLYHINFSIRNFSIFKGNVNYNMKDNELIKIVKKSFNFYRTDFKNKNIEINSQLKENIVNIECDKVNLGISFNNILYQIVDNATEESKVNVNLNKENENIAINLTLINPKDMINTAIKPKDEISTQYEFLNFIINDMIESHNGNYNILAEDNKINYNIELSV